MQAALKKIRALCSEVLSHNFPIPLLPTPRRCMKMTLETTQKCCFCSLLFVNLRILLFSFGETPVSI